MSTLGLGAYLESLGMQVEGMHWAKGMQDLESLGSGYARSRVTGYASSGYARDAGSHVVPNAKDGSTAVTCCRVECPQPPQYTLFARTTEMQHQ